MKTRITILLLLTILIITCKENNKPSSLSDLFSRTPHFQIKSRIINIDSLFIGNVYDIVGINNTLILLDEYNDKYLTLIDFEHNKLVARFGNKGRGPNEITDPTGLSIDKVSSELYVSLMNPDRIIRYVIDSIKKKTSTNYEEIAKFDFNTEVLFNATMLHSKDRFIATGMFHNGKYGIVGINGKLDTVIGVIIKSDKHKNINNYNIGSVYQGIIKSHPYNNKFVYASTNCDFIEIFNLDNYTTKRFFSYFPKLRDVNSHPIISRDSHIGYLKLKTTKKYIYVIFSGKTYNKAGGNAFFSKKLYVFDWSLKPICTYRLDYDINCMYITDDDKIMYSVVTTDEPVLVKYDLKHSENTIH